MSTVSMSNRAKPQVAAVKTWNAATESWDESASLFNPDETWDTQGQLFTTMTARSKASAVSMTNRSK